MVRGFKTKEMIVKQQFYCTQEKKTYKVGDLYKGKRKDIDHLFQVEIEVDFKEIKPIKKRK